MLDKRRTDDVVVVTFVLEEDSHHCPVCVAGDFNGWDVQANALQANGEGLLWTSIPLPAGRTYQFRYRDARGRWFNDEAADDYAANEWGGVNGVIET